MRNSRLAPGPAGSVGRDSSTGNLCFESASVALRPRKASGGDSSTSGVEKMGLGLRSLGEGLGVAIRNKASFTGVGLPDCLAMVLSLQQLTLQNYKKVCYSARHVLVNDNRLLENPWLMNKQSTLLPQSFAESVSSSKSAVINLVFTRAWSPAGTISAT